MEALKYETWNNGEWGNSYYKSYAKKGGGDIYWPIISIQWQIFLASILFSW